MKQAASFDVGQSTLSEIENQKRNVSKEILPELAKAFNLNIKNWEKSFVVRKLQK